MAQNDLIATYEEMKELKLQLEYSMSKLIIDDKKDDGEDDDQLVNIVVNVNDN